MTSERRSQLALWADPKRWPAWEMVMYVNNISVQEAMDFFASLYQPTETAEHVRRGIEAFTGGKITCDFVNHSFQFVLTVPTEYRADLQRE